MIGTRFADLKNTIINSGRSVNDMHGRTAAQLINGVIAEGEHTVQVNALKFPSGMYFARLQSGTQFQTIKMTLLK